MWLFTKYGMCSAVRDTSNKKRAYRERRYIVRFRLRSQAVSILKAYLKEDMPMTVTDDSDYRYRVFLSIPDFRRFMRKVADDVDYDNFKNAAYAYYTGPWLYNVWAQGRNEQISERNRERMQLGEPEKPKAKRKGH